MSARVEGRVERALIRAAQDRGLRCLKTVPTEVGFPDRIVMCPWAPPLLVEVKAPKGRLSEIQRHVHSRLERDGFDVAVVASQDEAGRTLDAYLHQHLYPS